jgi:Na+-transporting methylmalonyl-CoA/oxaloacetate decarboxylase gamma subunit
MAKNPSILIVLLVLAVAVGAIFLAVRRSPVEPEKQAAETAKKADETKPQAVGVHGAEIEQRDAQGKLQWKVSAGGELAFDKERQIATGKNVKFQVMQGEKAPVTISAPAFEADYPSRKLTFSQGVSGQVTDGSSRFSVGQIVYDFGTKKLQGSGGVTFVHGMYTATAQEIVVDPVHKKVRLRGGVKFARSS